MPTSTGGNPFINAISNSAANPEFCACTYPAGPVRQVLY